MARTAPFRYATEGRLEVDGVGVAGTFGQNGYIVAGSRGGRSETRPDRIRVTIAITVVTV